MLQRSLLLTKPGHLEWFEEDISELQPSEVLAPAFHAKELTLVGSSDGWDYQEHAQWYFSIVLEYMDLLTRIFDFRIEIESLISTFEQIVNGTIRPIKVLVHYP